MLSTEKEGFSRTRGVPSAQDAELKLLGAILDDDACFALPEVRSLTPHHFSSAVYSLVFDTMSELHREGKKVHLPALKERLQRNGDWEKVRGDAAYVKLQGKVLPAENLEYLVEFVKGKAALRGLKERLIEESGNIDDDKYRDIQEAVRRIQASVREAVVDTKTTEFEPFDLDGYEAWLEKHKEKEFVGFDTGFKMLNKFTRGLSGLWIVGGGPKVHKSTFVLQIASHVAENKVPVLYYDLENGRNRLLSRLHCRYGGIKWGELVLGTCDPEKYANGIQQLKEIQLYFHIIDDRREVTLEAIEAQVETIQKRHQTEELLIVIDPLQKLSSRQKERRLQIDEWLRNFEALKNEFGCAIMVVSELSRGEGYGDVSIKDFKESGDIEYTAETLIGICKPERSVTEYTVKILASRDGDPGNVGTYKPQVPYWYLEEKNEEGT